MYVKDGEWLVTTEKEKREFYSTGATLKNPEPKWPDPIIEYPTDFSDCIKNGRFWDWPKIYGKYRMFNPNLSEEQIKNHRAMLNITIAFPRFVEVEELEIEHPTNFEDFVIRKGNAIRWDYEGIVKLYKTDRDTAYHHFKHLQATKGISAKTPFIRTNEVWHVPAEILGPFDGGHVVIKPGKRQPVPANTPTQKSKLGSYLAEHYDKEDVVRELWHRYSIHVEI
jgi:hypothetical protein